MMEIISFYNHAKQTVSQRGFLPEAIWQASRSPSEMTESTFLQEAAWVIYCSGFKEATVRKYFDYLALCFFDWESAERIASNAEKCISTALLAFGAKRKHEAIVELAKLVERQGFHGLRKELIDAAEPTYVLQRFPYIGPITAVHLAKNLGFELAKPDRHLLRLMQKFGCRDVQSMCEEISEESGDTVKVVDIVLWRFLEQEGATAYGDFLVQ